MNKTQLKPLQHTKNEGLFPNAGEAGHGASTAIPGRGKEVWAAALMALRYRHTHHQGPVKHEGGTLRYMPVSTAYWHP